MYGPTPKRHITYTQTAPTVAHLWSADLRERRRVKAEMARLKEDVERQKAEMIRYRAYLELCHTIVMCRTKQGKVGVEYPILKAKLQDWVANYPTTPKEWAGIRRTLYSHNINHI